MDQRQRLHDGLELAVETIIRQAQSADSPQSLETPDFWTLGYAGGCCLFFLNELDIKPHEPLYQSSLIFAFGQIFPDEKASRMASYFLTFLNASDLVTDISDFASDFSNTSGLDGKGEDDFLQRVRGLYRVEVYEKFVSFAVSINQVVSEGMTEAENDMVALVSDESPVQPKSLMQHLLNAATVRC